VNSDYLNDSAFVEAFLYEKKNGCDYLNDNAFVEAFFSTQRKMDNFLSFYFLKKEFFFPPWISMPI